jgi:hypothetical protein
MWNCDAAQQGVLEWLPNAHIFDSHAGMASLNDFETFVATRHGSEGRFGATETMQVTQKFCEQVT